MNWKVYIILCSDDSLYTGITTNVEKRFEQHRLKKGAKYFYGREPLKILYVEEGLSHSAAASREWEIKQLDRQEKIALIQKNVDS